MKLYVSHHYEKPLRSHADQHEMGRRILNRMLQEPEYEHLLPYQIRKDSHGKPYMEGHTDICFNISHCPICTAVVISDQGEVGIDVQPRFPWKESLARQISTEKEYRWLLEAENEQIRSERLLQLWCRKESFLKCIGIGLQKELGEIPVLDQGGLLRCGAGNFRFLEMRSDRYALCICERVIE